MDSRVPFILGDTGCVAVLRARVSVGTGADRDEVVAVGPD